MNTTRHTRFSFTIIAALVLTASLLLVNCGGGGGGDGITTYTVTYDGNGNTGGSVPIDANAYAAGAIVTVLGNTNSLAKTGYSFGGWNTQADGNGTTYGATFTMGAANVTLYAKWTNTMWTKWTGTKQLGEAGEDTQANGVAVDASGNVYVAGIASITEDSLDGNTLIGTEDCFLTKYDSSGNMVRTKQTGTAGAFSRAYGVAVDASNNVYVAGHTNGGLDGNPLMGTDDFFVTKYDSSGTKLYTRQTGTAGRWAEAHGVAADASGNVYVVGMTNGGLDGTLTGAFDYFLTKYDSSGDKLYTRQTGTAGKLINALGVAVDSSGNVYVAGYTNGGLDGEIRNGAVDAFLTKYTSAGDKLYTRQTGTTGKSAYANGVAVDASGNVYVAGYTDGGLDGENFNGTQDAFLIKYNSVGDKLYTRLTGTTGAPTAATGVAVDASGNVYVTGHTYGGLDGNTLTGLSDFFVTKYGSTGNTVRTKQLGVAGALTAATGVAVDASGNVYVTGYTYGGLDGNTLSGTANKDFFVTKYDPDGNKQ